MIVIATAVMVVLALATIMVMIITFVVHLAVLVAAWSLIFHRNTELLLEDYAIS